MIRPKVLWFACVLAGIAAVLCASGPLEAGANSGHKIAVHVVAHGLACKSLPTFTECSQITTAYSGTGDIDVVPVFFNLSEYRVVEFGLTWPAEWGSCEYTRCTPTLDVGSITNFGDGMASAWTTCQTGWYVCPGYGWLNATGVGSVSVIPNPATGDYGVVDCAGSPGPYYDMPETAFAAGIGGIAGDDPCGGGGRDGGEDGGEGDLPALRITRVIEVTDGTTEYMQPIWSPDGTSLAFTRPGFAGVYVRSAEGTGPIVELTSAGYSGYKPVWTSDSKGIVIRTRTGVVGQSISYIDAATGQVEMLDAHAVHPGQPERNEYGDVTMEVDGQTKVLEHEAKVLRSVDADYLRDKPLSHDVRVEMDFKAKRLWIIEGDGATRREFPYRVLLARLSPTQDKVAFVVGDGNIYISALDGTSMVSLGRGDFWDWSPDGTRLLFRGNVVEDDYCTEAADIFVANSDGTGRTCLSHTPDVVEEFPVWSPDGMRIAYSGLNTGKIYVASLGLAN